VHDLDCDAGRDGCAAKAVAPISTAKKSAWCDGNKPTAHKKKTLVKWITTGLMKVRVPLWRSSVKKPLPSERATNSKPSNVAHAVPTSR
jgi:hypothetical protein